LRAYDLLQPTATQAPLPEGLRPLRGALPNYELLGWAGRESGKLARYAFYVHPKGPITNLNVVYHLNDGTQVRQPLEVRATLEDPPRLTGHDWFIFNDVGPSLDVVKDV